MTREGILQKRITDLLARADKAEAERNEARASIDRLNANNQALAESVADAERDMRQRAADLCENYGQGKQGMAAARAIKWAIVALPLKHADRDGQAALAQGQKEGD